MPPLNSLYATFIFMGVNCYVGKRFVTFEASVLLQISPEFHSLPFFLFDIILSLTALVPLLKQNRFPQPMLSLSIDGFKR